MTVSLAFIEAVTPTERLLAPLQATPALHGHFARESVLHKGLCWLPSLTSSGQQLSSVPRWSVIVTCALTQAEDLTRADSRLGSIQNQMSSENTLCSSVPEGSTGGINLHF